MKTVLILDPALAVNFEDYKPFIEGYNKSVYITWPEGQSPDYNEYNNSIMLGYVIIFSNQIISLSYAFKV
jgi:hypothetical protein